MNRLNGVGGGEVAVGNIRYCNEQSSHSNENTVVDIKIAVKIP